jgi:uncharacterized oxidoreductase
MNLQQKNIVITGATSGIGYEVAKRLHANNAVLVIARDRDKLDRLEAEFPGILTCQADLSIRADVESAARTALERLGTVDLLINNAAVQHTPALTDKAFLYETIQQEIAVNLGAVCALTALLLPALLKSPEAAILNVNSGLALMPKTESAVYCATKAAVNSFSQSLRYQLEGTSVKVMQAFMPLVDTNMTSGRGVGKLDAAQAADALIRGIEQDIEEHDIGKIRILRRLIRFAPGVARRIMRAA